MKPKRLSSRITECIETSSQETNENKQDLSNSSLDRINLPNAANSNTKIKERFDPIKEEAFRKNCSTVIKNKEAGLTGQQQMREETISSITDSDILMTDSEVSSDSQT